MKGVNGDSKKNYKKIFSPQMLVAIQKMNFRQSSPNMKFAKNVILP